MQPTHWSDSSRPLVLLSNAPPLGKGSHLAFEPVWIVWPSLCIVLGSSQQFYFSGFHSTGSNLVWIFRIRNVELRGWRLFECRLVRELLWCVFHSADGVVYFSFCCFVNNVEIKFRRYFTRYDRIKCLWINFRFKLIESFVVNSKSDFRRTK